jgi:NAD(P)-dependent dehydrogenase (short-subunit alcohol dehydrogenase family)
MPLDIKGLTCLVTGANRGIGLPVAQRLAHERI